MKLNLNTTRLLVALPTLGMCFGVIYCDIVGRFEVDKAIYAAIGSWVTLIIQFFFRKAGTEVSANKE